MQMATKDDVTGGGMELDATEQELVRRLLKGESPLDMGPTLQAAAWRMHIRLSSKTTKPRVDRGFGAAGKGVTLAKLTAECLLAADGPVDKSDVYVYATQNGYQSQTDIAGQKNSCYQALRAFLGKKQVKSQGEGSSGAKGYVLTPQGRKALKKAYADNET